MAQIYNGVHCTHFIVQMARRVAHLPFLYEEFTSRLEL